MSVCPSGSASPKSATLAVSGKQPAAIHACETANMLQTDSNAIFEKACTGGSVTHGQRRRPLL